MSTVVIVVIYTVLVFATSAIGALTGIGGGVVRKPVFDALGNFNATEIAFLNVLTVLAMSLVSIIKQSKNFRFVGIKKKSTTAPESTAAPESTLTPESAKAESEGAAECSLAVPNPEIAAESCLSVSNPEIVAESCLSVSNPEVAAECSLAVPNPEIAAGSLAVPNPEVAADGVPAEAEIGEHRGAPACENETPAREIVKEEKDNRPVFGIGNLILLSIGSVVGGVGGEALFSTLVKDTPDANVKLVQNCILLVLVVAVLAYMIWKDKIPTAHLKNPVWYVLAGLILGILSSFLGIGGGPMNLAVLMLMFSMSTKEAAYSSLLIILVSQLSKLVISAISGTILAVTAPLVYTSVGFLVLGAVAGGFVGSALTKKLSDKTIAISFNLLQIVLIGIIIYNVVRACGSF